MMILKHKIQSGFSLLEALLTTLVVSAVFVVIFNIISDFAENTLARTTANYMNKLSFAIEEVVINPENFQNIYAEVNTRGGAWQLSVADLSNQINANGQIIQPPSSVNANIRNNTPLRTGVNIIIRIADNPIITTDTPALEIIVAVDEPVDDRRVRKVASELKLNGGFYRVAGDNARGAFNSWSFDPLVNLSGTQWATDVAATPPDISGQGTYLIHYKHVNFEDIAGDYLYRVAVLGSPELNQIYTDLNMGGNDILGADNMNAAQALNVDSKIVSNGVSSATNLILDNGNFTAGGTFETVNATINGVGGGATGNFVVQGALNTNQTNLTQNLSSNTANFTNGMNASQSLSVEQINGVNTIETSDMFITTLDVGSLVDMDVGNQLNAQDINIQTLNVVNGEVGTVDAFVGNNVSVGGAVTSSRITIDTLQVDEFGLCDNDCLAF